MGVGGIACIVLVVLLVGGDRLLGAFGSGFLAARPVLGLLILGQVVNAFCGPTGVLLSMTGRQRLASRALWLGAIVNVILNVLLIPRYGVTGAALATVISTTTWNAALVYLVRRELGFGPTFLSAVRSVRQMRIKGEWNR